MDSPITPPLQIMAVRLTEERQRQGRSIADVARSAGIAKSTLSQLESAQETRESKHCGRSVWH